MKIYAYLQTLRSVAVAVAVATDGIDVFCDDVVVVVVRSPIASRFSSPSRCICVDKRKGTGKGKGKGKGTGKDKRSGKGGV